MYCSLWCGAEDTSHMWRLQESAHIWWGAIFQILGDENTSETGCWLSTSSGESVGVILSPSAAGLLVRLGHAPLCNTSPMEASHTGALFCGPCRPSSKGISLPFTFHINVQRELYWFQANLNKCQSFCWLNFTCHWPAKVVLVDCVTATAGIHADAEVVMAYGRWLATGTPPGKQWYRLVAGSECSLS